MALSFEGTPPTPASPASVLPLLDLTISPTSCQGAVGLPAEQVKQIIRSTAIDLFLHEKAAGIWKKNVRNKRKSLLFFIRLVESDLSSPALAPQASNSLRAALPLPRPSSASSPPKLKELADFEHLYYATCCKIRELYSDITTRANHFGASMLQKPLHASSGAFLLSDMATLLRAYWAALSFPALITTLDLAARTRSSQGLWDTNKMPVGAVMALLWDKQRAHSAPSAPKAAAAAPLAIIMAAMRRRQRSVEQPQQEVEPFCAFVARLPPPPANTTKPLPPLPPATKAQRYVAADGPARLEEREEVVVPGLVLPQYDSVAWMEEMEEMVEMVVNAERVSRGERGNGAGPGEEVEGRKRRGVGGWWRRRWR